MDNSNIRDRPNARSIANHPITPETNKHDNKPKSKFIWHLFGKVQDKRDVKQVEKSCSKQIWFVQKYTSGR